MKGTLGKFDMKIDADVPNTKTKLRFDTSIFETELNWIFTVRHDLIEMMYANGMTFDPSRLKLINEFRGKISYPKIDKPIVNLVALSYSCDKWKFDTIIHNLQYM